jgi:hypothetical protein
MDLFFHEVFLHEVSRGFFTRFHKVFLHEVSRGFFTRFYEVFSRGFFTRFHEVFCTRFHGFFARGFTECWFLDGVIFRTAFHGVLDGVSRSVGFWTELFFARRFTEFWTAFHGVLVFGRCYFSHGVSRRFARCFTVCCFFDGGVLFLKYFAGYTVFQGNGIEIDEITDFCA